MRRTNSLEKTLMLGKIEGGRRRPPAYHLLGFDAALELPVKRGHQVRFMLSADNLLNREYKEYTNRSRYYAHDMGRDVRCGVNWIF